MDRAALLATVPRQLGPTTTGRAAALRGLLTSRCSVDLSGAAATRAPSGAEVVTP